MIPIPKGAVFANSLIGALSSKPRTALELCAAAASAQRRRWASFVQKRGPAWAKQQVHLDLQTLKRLGIVERVRLLGRCDLWRLSKPLTWGQKFEKLPRKARAKFMKLAYDRREGLLIVKQGGKLVGLPKYDVLDALKTLGIEVEAELILLS